MRNIGGTQQQLFNSPLLVAGHQHRSTASTSVTPAPSPEPMVTTIGELLQSDYQMHELPPGDGGQEACCAGPDSDEVVLNTALLAQTEALESQNRVLTEKLQVTMDRKSILPEMTKL